MSVSGEVDKAAQSIPVIEINPDYRKHDGRDMSTHCFRCGRGVRGDPACTIRVDYNGMMKNAWSPADPGDAYYIIGSECKRYVPTQFRNEPGQCTGRKIMKIAITRVAWYLGASAILLPTVAWIRADTAACSDGHCSEAHTLGMLALTLGLLAGIGVGAFLVARLLVRATRRRRTPPPG